MDGDVLTFLGVMLSLGTVGVLVYAGISLVTAMRHRLERRPAPGLSSEDLDEIHLRLAQAAELEVRVAELEERLDYSERLLVQARRGPDPD